MTDSAAVIMVAIFLMTGILSWVGTGVVRRWLSARQILDQPNARSSHHIPVPRGGGVAVVFAITPPCYAVTLRGNPFRYAVTSLIIIVVTQ